MMTLSFCCVVKYFTVIIKSCETSMPKQLLCCDHKMIGLGVSHGFMAAINPFFHLPMMFLFLQAQDQMKCNISEAKFKFIIFVVIVGTLFLES